MDEFNAEGNQEGTDVKLRRLFLKFNGNHANEEETSALLFDAAYHITIDNLYFYVPLLFLNY